MQHVYVTFFLNQSKHSEALLESHILLFHKLFPDYILFQCWKHWKLQMIWELYLYSSVISLLSPSFCLSLSLCVPLSTYPSVSLYLTYPYLYTLTPYLNCLLDMPRKCWRSCNIRCKPVPRLTSFSVAQSLLFFYGLPYFPFIPYIESVTRSRPFHLLCTSVSAPSFLIPHAPPWHRPHLTQCLPSFCLCDSRIT